MTIDQITDIAWAVVDELEPSRSFDVFDVSESSILFHSEHGLKKVCVTCPGESLREQIKRELCR
ncbi:MAG: hypothetical protein ACLGJB_23285 [Blastocatellia bacterium]